MTELYVVSTYLCDAFVFISVAIDFSCFDLIKSAAKTQKHETKW